MFVLLQAPSFPSLGTVYLFFGGSPEGLKGTQPYQWIELALTTLEDLQVSHRHPMAILVPGVPVTQALAGYTIKREKNG